MSARARVVAAVDASGLGGPLRGIKRRFEPAAVTFDRAEHGRLLALVSRTLSGDDCGIDIGANEGAVTDAMVAAAPRGRHLAFEPIPALAGALRARHPLVGVHPLALSDHAGEADFAHVVTRPGWSGFRERPTPGRDRVETIRVPVGRLDDVPLDGRVPKLIKVDVEGAEREVLAGAADTLSRHCPMVIFEHGLGSADHYGTEPRHLWELLVDGAALELYDLEGSGPYTLARFERAFAARERTNFVARAESIS